jgi:hypothetical protein
VFAGKITMTLFVEKNRTKLIKRGHRQLVKKQFVALCLLPTKQQVNAKNG